MVQIAALKNNDAHIQTTDYVKSYKPIKMINKMKRFTYLLASLFLASTVFISCSGDDPDPEVPVIVIPTPSELTQTVAATATQGTSTVRFTAPGTWSSSSNATWASISPASGAAGNAEVTITLQPNLTREARTAVITITSPGAEPRQITITQDGATEVTIPVTSVTINQDDKTLVVGTSTVLTAGIVPENATNPGITWSSNAPAYATVHATTGEVTAIAPGVATITVTTADGGHTDTVEITVIPVAVTGVTLSPATINLLVGANETLTATVAPTNAANTNVTWGSSDEAVVTVVNGVVTAVAVGSATITVTTVDGDFYATSTVTVTAPPVDGPVDFSLTAGMFTASSQNAPNWLPANLVTDDIHQSFASYWMNRSEPTWIRIDLGEVINPAYVGFRFRNHTPPPGGGHHDVLATDFQISMDGTTWTNIGGRFNFPAGNGAINDSNPIAVSQSFRFVRFNNMIGAAGVPTPATDGLVEVNRIWIYTIAQ